MKSLIVMLTGIQVLMTGYLLTSGENRSATDNATPFKIEGRAAQKSNYQPVEIKTIVSRRVIF